MHWFKASNFGVFVHWGFFDPFYQPQEFRDWTSHALPEAEYQRRAGLIGSEHLSVADWAAVIKNTGATYAMITTIHSTGLAIWDSLADPRTVRKMTECRKDMVAEWCDALRGEGLKIGLYFCHADWNDPDFSAAMENPALREQDEEKRDAAWQRYLIKHRVRLSELLTQYGGIDYLYADGDWFTDAIQWNFEDLVARIRKWQPRMLINQGFCGIDADVMSYEGKIPPEMTGTGDAVELLDKMNVDNHWHYLPSGMLYRSAHEIIGSMIHCIWAGGNYLLNIAPKWDGELTLHEKHLLEITGEFYKRHEKIFTQGKPGLIPGSFEIDGVLQLFVLDESKPISVSDPLININSAYLEEIGSCELQYSRPPTQSIKSPSVKITLPKRPPQKEPTWCKLLLNHD